MKNWLILALLLSPLSLAGTGCVHDHDDDMDNGVTTTERRTKVTHDRDDDDDAKKVTTEKKTTVKQYD